jgi:hypothetical protein
MRIGIRHLHLDVRFVNVITEVKIFLLLNVIEVYCAPEPR